MNLITLQAASPIDSGAALSSHVRQVQIREAVEVAEHFADDFRGLKRLSHDEVGLGVLDGGVHGQAARKPAGGGSQELVQEPERARFGGENGRGVTSQYANTNKIHINKLHSYVVLSVAGWY